MNVNNRPATPGASQAQPRSPKSTRPTAASLQEKFRAQSVVLKKLKTDREKQHWKKFYRKFDLNECRTGVEEFRGKVGKLLVQVGGTTDMEIWKLKTSSKQTSQYGSAEKLKQLQARLECRRERNNMFYQRQKDGRDNVRKELKGLQKNLGVLKEKLGKQFSTGPKKPKSAPQKPAVASSSKSIPSLFKLPTKGAQKEPAKVQRSTRSQSITVEDPIPSTSGTQRETRSARRPRSTPDVRFLKEKKPKPKTRSVFSEYKRTPAPATPVLEIGPVKMEVPEEVEAQTGEDGGNEEPEDYFASQLPLPTPEKDVQGLGKSLRGMTIIIPLQTPRPPPVTTPSTGTSTNVEGIDENSELSTSTSGLSTLNISTSCPSKSGTSLSGASYSGASTSGTSPCGASPSGPSTSGASSSPIQTQPESPEASTTFETPKKEEKPRKFNIKLKPKSGIGEQSMLNTSLTGNSPGSSSGVSPVQAGSSQSSQKNSSPPPPEESSGASGAAGQRRRKSSSFLTDDFLSDILGMD